MADADELARNDDGESQTQVLDQDSQDCGPDAEGLPSNAEDGPSDVDDEAPRADDADEEEEEEEEQEMHDEEGLEEEHGVDGAADDRSTDGGEQDKGDGPARRPDRGERSQELVQPKRPPTAYFLFVRERRAETAEEGAAAQSRAEFSKACGTAWRSMSDEERQTYARTAAELRREYDEKLAAFKAAGGAMRTSTERSLELPVARVLRLMKKDPSTKKIQRAASQAVTKATEEFLGFLCQAAAAQLHGSKRQIDYAAVRSCIMQGPEELEFLEDDFPEVRREIKTVVARADRQNRRIAARERRQRDEELVEESPGENRQLAQSPGDGPRKRTKRAALQQASLKGFLGRAAC